MRYRCNRVRDPILLVGEDDAFAMYAEFLQHRGLDTFLSTSPAEALAQLSTLRPAIVVSELAFGGDLQAG
jgi:ActR/RegA family two-component response regulator